MKPKLIVFDLDYTLWPFWIGTHIHSPLKKERNGQVVDGRGEKLKPYPEVTDLLKKLSFEGYILGIASRSEWPKGATELVKLLDWDKYFMHKEIYPGRKTEHFKRIKEASGLDYSEMIFFDDEQRNIVDLKKIGVKSILVTDGVNSKLVENAIQSFGTT